MPDLGSISGAGLLALFLLGIVFGPAVIRAGTYRKALLCRELQRFRQWLDTHPDEGISSSSEARTLIEKIIRAEKRASPIIWKFQWSEAHQRIQVFQSFLT